MSQQAVSQEAFAMSTTESLDRTLAPAAAADLGAVADDLARASLAMARRYNVPGATLWCASSRWPCARPSRTACSSAAWWTA